VDAGLMPPAEVSVFIDPDGSVTFSDLPADLAEVALALDPQAAPACPVSKHARRPRKETR
jgi:hypothetical protein